MTGGRNERTEEAPSGRGRGRCRRCFFRERISSFPFHQRSDLSRTDRVTDPIEYRLNADQPVSGVVDKSQRVSHVFKFRSMAVAAAATHVPFSLICRPSERRGGSFHSGDTSPKDERVGWRRTSDMREKEQGEKLTHWY